jgi:tripartite-type tricarboxylate transporter receptor subunit TctC
MTGLLRSLLLTLLVLLASYPAHAQRRVALVIGNAAYAEAPLKNPVNDATDVSAKLKQLGFDVVTATNRNRSQMTTAIREFGRRSAGADAALFYFAGHGIAVRGKNYLLPVGQSFSDEAEVETEAVEVNSVLARIEEAGAKVSVLILDACRNNPLPPTSRSASRGLARMEAPSGALVAFAAQPGAVAKDGAGRNGTFTKHLLAHMGTPGLPVEQVFKRVRAAVEQETGRSQSPREESSLTADFYFVGPGGPQGSVAPEPVPVTPRPGVQGGVSLEDLQREEQVRREWAQWQAGMKADFDKLLAFSSSADLRVKAWERFLATWAQDNPTSTEDDAMRRQAQDRLGQARREVASASTSPQPLAVPVQANVATPEAPMPALPTGAALPGPVRLVVPYAAGGATDVTARVLADALRPLLGQVVVVENRAGAGGTLGAKAVVGATPDGTTLLLHQLGMVTAPGLYRRLDFRVTDDFEPLGVVAEMPMVLVSRANLPSNGWQDMVSWLRKSGSNATIATGGLGSASHLCALLLKQAVAGQAVTVPYRGSAPAMTDLIGGQTDVMCDAAAGLSAQVGAGRLKSFAVTGRTRSATNGLTGLPTVTELGHPEMVMTNWTGVYAPRGMPAALVDRLNAALRHATRDAQFRQRMAEMGAEVVGDVRATPAGHRQFLTAELARWTPILRAAGEFAD